MGSLAPEQVEAYEPTGLAEVATVEQVGGVAGATPPFTNPAYEAVIVGTEAPYTNEPPDAVTVRAALVTLTEPATVEKV